MVSKRSPLSLCFVLFFSYLTFAPTFEICTLVLTHLPLRKPKLRQVNITTRKLLAGLSDGCV